MLFLSIIVRFIENIWDRSLQFGFFFPEECLIVNDPGKYHYVAQGMLTIDNVDDAEEMRITDEAFDILGFNKVCIGFNNNKHEKEEIII